jgi:hypothetical protein
LDSAVANIGGEIGHRAGPDVVGVGDESVEPRDGHRRAQPFEPRFESGDRQFVFVASHQPAPHDHFLCVSTIRSENRFPRFGIMLNP